MTDKDKETVKEKSQPEKANKKQPIRFYFPKSAKHSYRTQKISIRADNHVYTLEPDNPQYVEILEFLRNHRDNTANNGLLFYELSATEGENDTNRGKLIDKLMNMTVQQLRRACGDDLSLHSIQSKGKLIDIYLEQQEL